jgi:predicted Na+-dependent transporter
MAVSTVMTIFLTPTLYRLFNRDKVKRDIENIANLVEEEAYDA